MSDSGGTESKEAIPLEDIALNEESQEKIPSLNDEDKPTNEVTKKEKRSWFKKKDVKEEDKVRSASIREIFSFATPFDCVIMLLGIFCAIVIGTGMPLAFLVFGEFINAFINEQATSGVVDLLTEQIVYTSYNDSSNNNVIFYKATPELFNCTDLGPIVEEYYQTSADLVCQSNAVFNPSGAVTSNFTFSINSINCGVLDSAFSQLYGGITSCTTEDSFFDTANTFTLYFVVIAVVVIAMGFFMVAAFQVASERQVFKMRLAYYRAVLRQDVGWFDLNPSGEVASRLADDLDKVQTGLGEKLVILFQFVTTFFTAFIIGFLKDWRLTLALLSIVPFLMIGGALLAVINSKFTSKEQKNYASAGAIAEEVLSSVKTVLAFGGEFKESQRYDSCLVDARNFGVKKGMAVGGGIGYIFFFLFASYSLAFWFGGWLISQELAQGGDILLVFFCVIIGAFSIGQAGPNFEAFSSALGAGGAIFEVIKRQPPIDSSSNEGLVPDKEDVTSVHFKDVNFTYPARPDVQVLKSFNMNVGVGQTVALVGHSGCGKSTVIQLLQRFYDMDSGEIHIGSHSIKDLNLKFLRNMIGVVSQEPVLFDTTIADNIRYGREDASQEEIKAAASTANVHDFIMGLPDGYNTLVGERGTQLSGGQKQRVAIARALIRNPKILLLDEATSALDSESESLVQAALEKASQGRTTIVIAHRLSTIQNADHIVCLSEGEVVETGTHNELMKLQGLYYDMVTAQTHGGVDDAFLTLQPSLEEISSKEKPAVLRMYSRQISHQFSRQISEKDKGEKTKSEINKKKQEEWDKDLKEVSLGRIIALNAKEWWIIAIGILAALINGSIFPLFAIFFGELLKAFSVETSEVLNKVHLPAGLFLALAFVSAASNFIKIFCFSVSGEYLTARIRSRAFKAILRQEMAWFDEERNSTGALTTRLAEDAAQVQGATGSRLAILVETMFSLLLALVIAFVYSWIMTLVILGFSPFLILTGIARTIMFRRHLLKNKAAQSEAGKLAVDSLENIRTVTSLNLQNKFGQLYENEVRKPYRTALVFDIIEGLAYGISQGMMFFGYAITFRFGAFLVTLDDNHLLHTEFYDLFRALFAIVFGAFAIGQASAFAPDYAKAKLSSNRIFSLLDREPVIDNYSTEGKELDSVEGSVLVKNVSFNYPSRPNVPVLQDISLSANPGQTIAFVGPSGCGKSTIVSLIERFYDVLEGGVLLDGVNVCDLNIRWLRSQIGLVSQEPVLFDISIADNIRYGSNDRLVSDEEVIEAAKAANIHEFIQALPHGYTTNAGDKGTQLSGGQKQRIAIARALIRNPKILLLDEATSALDSESEQVVQEALDKAREGRTSIVIAHRLSTVYNADCIIVITHGKVVESGTHSQLIASGGLYYQLHQRQELAF